MSRRRCDLIRSVLLVKPLHFDLPRYFMAYFLLQFFL